MTAGATLRTPGQSTLPRLTTHLSVPLLLMDLTDAIAGLTRQMTCAAEAFGVGELVVVDVGGDILAEGHEQGLRSPLADTSALAAAVATGLPAHVLVAGVELDGELTRSELSGRLKALAATEVAVLEPADVAGFSPIWSWHPSETSGLLAVAAAGWRGAVEIQRDAVVDLTDAVAAVHQVDAAVLAGSSLAAVLTSASNLTELEEIFRSIRSYSDIDIERDRATTRRPSANPTVDTLQKIDRYADEAAERGVDAMTLRRVAELAHATDPTATARLRELLAVYRHRQFKPPIYGVGPVF
jgi:hypothetical protein